MHDAVTIWKIIGYSIITVAIIIGVWFVINYPVPEAHGQNATPNPVAPTVTNQPTPTTPTPNFQYLPQKAYVQPFKPEVGIPENSIPLTAVPQVVPQQIPVQPVQNNSSNIIDSLGGIGGITAMLGAAGVYFKTRVLDKKTDKIDDTTKQQSQQIVKGAIVDQKIADQVYQNMGEEANKINDKPEIKLENLKANIDEATETATKA